MTSFTLPLSLIEWVDQQAEERGVSRAEVFRLAIAAFQEAVEAKPAGKRK